MKQTLLAALAAVVVVTPAGPVNAQDCPRSLSAEVDYSRSDAQLVRDGGYTVAGGSIEPDTSFRDLPAATVTFEVVRPGRRMHTRQVLSALKHDGLRPATLKEVLAIGITQPEVLVSCGNLVALGTKKQNRSPYIAIGSAPSIRYLGAYSIDEEWDAESAFVAVDKDADAEPKRHSGFLPHFELAGGVMLPGYYTQDTSGGEIQTWDGTPLAGEGSWGLSLIGADVTLVRWGRLRFGGIAVVFGLRYSGWDGGHDDIGERTDGLSVDIIAATPVLLRISKEELRLKGDDPQGEWYLYGAYGWNFLRTWRKGYNGQKGNWLFGVAYNFSR